MGLLRLLGKLSGVEGKVKWSKAKKIEVVGPDFFGHYFVYVDPEFYVAIFLPKSDRYIAYFCWVIFFEQIDGLNVTRRGKGSWMELHRRRLLNGRLIKKMSGSKGQDFHLVNLVIVGKSSPLKISLMK